MVNFNSDNTIYAGNPNDLNKIFSDDLQGEILQIIGGQNHAIGGEQIFEDRKLELETDSLQDIGKLSSQDKVLDWLGPGSVYYNDESFSNDRLYVTLAQNSTVDSNIKKALEAAMSESDDSLKEPLPLERSCCDHTAKTFSWVYSTKKSMEADLCHFTNSTQSEDFSSDQV